MRVTLQQVADRAGLSRSGASRALRNDPSIPEETRERVRQMAAELGYAPHPFVTALMSSVRAGRAPQEPEVIALVHQDPDRELMLAYPWGRRLLLGVRNRAAGIGFRLEEFGALERGMTPQRLEKILTTRGIRGVCFSPAPHPGWNIPFRCEGLAVIAAGFSVSQPATHRVATNVIGAVAMAMRNLRRIGYRKIALAVQMENDDRTNRGWTAGYLAACRADEGKPILWLDPVWKEHTYVPWFKKTRPEAIISPHAEALGWLREAGFDAPRDFAFATLDWHAEQAKLAGVDQCPDRLGTILIDQLVAQINRNEFGIPQEPVVTLVDGTWRDGPTAPGLT